MSENFLIKAVFDLTFRIDLTDDDDRLYPPLTLSRQSIVSLQVFVIYVSVSVTLIDKVYVDLIGSSSSEGEDLTSEGS